MVVVIENCKFSVLNFYDFKIIRDFQKIFIFCFDICKLKLSKVRRFFFMFYKLLFCGTMVGF